MTTAGTEAADAASSSAAGIAAGRTSLKQRRTPVGTTVATIAAVASRSATDTKAAVASIASRPARATETDLAVRQRFIPRSESSDGIGLFKSLMAAA